MQSFSLNASKNFAPAFPAWCATPEKLRIDFCLNSLKTVKKSRFYGITHLAVRQRVEKPFSARWQTVKKVPEAEQLAPVGVQRYGRARVATEVKILAEQAELQQNRSLYEIGRAHV